MLYLTPDAAHVPKEFYFLLNQLTMFCSTFQHQECQTAIFDELPPLDLEVFRECGGVRGSGAADGTGQMGTSAKCVQSQRGFSHGQQSSHISDNILPNFEQPMRCPERVYFESRYLEHLESSR